MKRDIYYEVEYHYLLFWVFLIQKQQPDLGFNGFNLFVMFLKSLKCNVVMHFVFPVALIIHCRQFIVLIPVHWVLERKSDILTRAKANQLFLSPNSPSPPQLGSFPPPRFQVQFFNVCIITLWFSDLKSRASLTFFLRHHELTNEYFSYFLVDQWETKTFIDLKGQMNQNFDIFYFSSILVKYV